MKSHQLLFTSNNINDRKFFIKMITIDHFNKKYPQLSDLFKIFEYLKKTYNMALLSFLYNVQYGENVLISLTDFKLIVAIYFLSNSELKLNVSEQDYYYLLQEYNNNNERFIDNCIFIEIAEKIILQILQQATLLFNEKTKITNNNFQLIEEDLEYLLDSILSPKTMSLLKFYNKINSSFYHLKEKDIIEMSIFKENDRINIAFYSKLLSV